jgi:hypothetical protein
MDDTRASDRSPGALLLCAICERLDRTANVPVLNDPEASRKRDPGSRFPRQLRKPSVAKSSARPSSGAQASHVQVRRH